MLVGQQCTGNGRSQARLWPITYDPEQSLGFRPGNGRYELATGHKPRYPAERLLCNYLTGRYPIEADLGTQGHRVTLQKAPSGCQSSSQSGSLDGGDLFVLFSYG